MEKHDAQNDPLFAHDGKTAPQKLAEIQQQLAPFINRFTDNYYADLQYTSETVLHYIAALTVILAKLGDQTQQIAQLLLELDEKIEGLENELRK